MLISVILIQVFFIIFFIFIFVGEKILGHIFNSVTIGYIFSVMATMILIYNNKFEAFLEGAAECICPEDLSKKKYNKILNKAKSINYRKLVYLTYLIIYIFSNIYDYNHYNFFQKWKPYKYVNSKNITEIIITVTMIDAYVVNFYTNNNNANIFKKLKKIILNNCEKSEKFK